MNSRILLISGILLLFSNCRQKVKYDYNSWISARGFEGRMGYDRDMMIDDLMDNHHFRGMHYSKLKELLGSPDYNDTSGITYNIKENYGSDIDPVYSKDLYFKLNKDSVITDVKIKEWKK